MTDSHMINNKIQKYQPLNNDIAQQGWKIEPLIVITVGVSRTSPKACPKHQGHKGDPGVTPGTCGAGGEKAQVILVWVRAPGVGNASHPRRLGVIRERP
jgi:hypothetical protein